MKPLHILWQNDYEIMAYKPAGLAIELSNDKKKSSFISQIRHRFPFPYSPQLPYRLDRIACGLAMAALTPESIAFYNEQIRNRNWHKWYAAKIWAHPQKEMEQFLGIQKAYFKRKGRKAEIVRAGGKPGFLEILYLEPTAKQQQWYALIRLLTGRYHQIRATFSHLGIPLVGDWLYGSGKEDENAFYLEHIALKYPDFLNKKWKVAFWAENPERESLSTNFIKQLQNQIKEKRP